MVKISAAACVLLAAGSASAYSVPNRSTLRSMGTKSIPTSSSRRVGASMKMEGEFCLLMLSMDDGDHDNSNATVITRVLSFRSPFFSIM